MTIEPSDVALIEILLGDIRDIFGEQSVERLTQQG
jgi:hypothetical protein